MQRMFQARDLVGTGVAVVACFLLLTQAGWCQNAPTPSQLPTYIYGCGGFHYHCCHTNGFYTTDGRHVFYFPYGFPRSVHRHNIYSGYGPDFRFSTRYRWTSRPLHWGCPCHPAYQMQFQGPYWAHTTYRAARGLFHRSNWKCAWIPYYVAAIPAAPVLGVAPTGPATPAYPAPGTSTLPGPATLPPARK
ncbi:MAG: hypothetical protein OZSIB_0514 [Candidatus Ozemobacter sibiricus]|uniref:Uncharacterized protein n=1 Tax=Candidatus Ozemobacter sibiricus TaxID=2268124 RepID=A0A367ZLJ6_9BACT|nr:MAG: hypothetical protein OZSIB_0514 [Candidatus Ozemobacter sibiricus]